MVVDGEPLQALGGQAYWSFGGLFLVNSPEQRRLRVKRLDELALADWLGSAALRPPRGLLAAALGRGVRRLRRRRAARLAARARGSVLPAGAVGRAGRLPRARPRQLRAALPRHLGHRARAGRAVRRAGAGRPAGCGSAPAQGHRLERRRCRRDRVRVGPGAHRRAARRAEPRRGRSATSRSRPRPW